MYFVFWCKVTKTFSFHQLRIGSKASFTSISACFEPCNRRTQPLRNRFDWQNFYYFKKIANFVVYVLGSASKA